MHYEHMYCTGTSLVAQGMVQLGEHRDQPDGEGDVIMCQYLEWELNVDPVTLQEFEE